MSSEFERATALQSIVHNGENGEERRYSGDIPDLWQQGKGAFGGVTVGLLTRAIVLAEADRGRTLRSLSAELCAPALPGPVEIAVTSMRRGGSMSFVEARLTQGDALVAHASASLAAPRAIAPAAIRPVPPRRPPWRDVATIPVEAPLGPVFAKKYEYRSTGPLPFASGPEPAAEGWIREKETPTVLDEAAIAGLLDAWWPAILAIESAPRAVATVGYTMQLLVDPRSLDPAEPLFHRARAVAGSDNFFVEMRELWSGDTVVAMNQQTFALLS